MDPTLYRRRQRRRAAIGWTALIAVAALVAVGIAVGSDGGHHHGDDDAAIGIFTASMTASQYESIREGEERSVITKRLGNVGMEAGEVEEELLALFPHRPSGSDCAYWYLSDAPEHLVRLCFDDDRDVLLQKSVAAQGESEIPKTLV